MITKYIALTVNVWTDGAWASEDGQSFLAARRELYDIAEDQYADTVALIEKLEKGVVYLGRAVEATANLETVEREAAEYCSIKSCDQYVQDLVKVFISRRTLHSDSTRPSSTAIDVAKEVNSTEGEAKPELVYHEISVENKLWLEYDQVFVANVQEFDRRARSRGTCAALQRSNFAVLATNTLKEVGEYLAAEILKRGHFDDWESLFSAQSEMCIAFASDVDRKVQALASEALNHTANFYTANRQDPNEKYQSFSAVGVLAGVGSFLSEMKHDKESADFASDVDRQICAAISPEIDKILELLCETAINFYDSFAPLAGLIGFQDMSARQVRADGWHKNFGKISDPKVAAAALVKIFEEFPFQNREFVNHINASSTSDKFKQDLLSRLEPYLPELKEVVDVEPEVVAQEADVMRRVVASRHSLPDAKVWLIPHIPKSKFSAIRSTLGGFSNIEYENALLYYDDTMFGKGDDGILISDTHLFFRTPFERPNIIQLKSIIDVKFTGTFNKSIGVTWLGGGASFTVSGDKVGAILIFEILQGYLSGR